MALREFIRRDLLEHLKIPYRLALELLEPGPHDLFSSHNGL